MKSLDKHTFDTKALRRELEELKLLLDNVAEPKEAEHLSPLFKRCKNLTSLLGIYAPETSRADSIGYELSLAGDFSCDIVVGDSRTKAYCLIELEDAAKKSIFDRAGKKATRDWSPRFEHAFSQIVDWFYKLADIRQTNEFERLFGRHAKFAGLMVIGRRDLLEPGEAERLRWRVDKVLVDSNKVFCVTFDELYEDMKAQLDIYEQAYLASQ